jgi:2',3'-cyclic-nucleotide 2'-phosphodiesterase (5'-nucleotidase family)
VILAGHVHGVMAHEVAGIPVVSTSLGGRAFSRVDVTIDRATGRVSGHEIFPPRDLCARENPRTQACVAGTGAGSRVARYEDAPVSADDRIARVLAPAIQKVAALKAMPLGVFAEAPVRRGG